MSENRDPKSLKHRHDVGEPDHHAVSTHGVTQGIQFTLGLCIALTVALLIYFLTSL